MLNQSLNIYELQLIIGLDIVKLGEDRQTVISRLGEPKSSVDGNYYKRDYYAFKSVRLEYDFNTLECVSIEILPPAKVMYGGVDLLSLKYDEALRWVHALDSNVEEDEDPYGYDFVAHTIQIGMNTKLFAEGAIEALIIFSEEYWPSAEEREANIERRVQERLSQTTNEEAKARLEARMNRVSGPDSVS